jgi:RNA polymerase sigma-70 factor (ECF subfamily)
MKPRDDMSPHPQTQSGQLDASGVDADPLAAHGEAYFAALFRKYRTALFRYLSGMVSSPGDAAELVQESYARLLRQTHVQQLEAVSRTYLFSVATNLARDLLRRRTTRHSNAHWDIDELNLEDQRSGPEHELVWAQTLHSIKQAIKELPPSTRRVFLLSRFRSKTYPEIAALLGVSTRTVERKMSEAMDAIAARLEHRL